MLKKILYKLSKTGKVLEWQIEIIKSKYRTISGQKDGNKVTSEWTEAIGVNIGKANETTAEEQAELEVASEYTKKIKSGYMESIISAKEDKRFSPMLAKDYNDYRQKIDYSQPIILQPKLDGVRCIASKDGLFSRNREKFVSCPHIEEITSKICKDNNIILDGELYNHRLNEDFNKIVSLVRKEKLSNEDILQSSRLLEYHIYDTYSLDNTELVYTERYKLIKDINKEKLIIVDTIIKDSSSEEEIIDLYDLFISEGYEGAILRLNTPYVQKRTSNLLKIKEFDSEEFTIVDIIEGIGNRSKMAGKIKYLIKETNKTFDSGIAGGEDFYKEILKDKNKYIGGEGTVKFFKYTPDGIPRFPVTTCVYKKKRNI